MCLHPSKFLWPELMSFWDGKNEAIVSECVEIIAKMNILTDPGSNMNQLLDALALRASSPNSSIKQVSLSLVCLDLLLY